MIWNLLKTIFLVLGVITGVFTCIFIGYTLFENQNEHDIQVTRINAPGILSLSQNQYNNNLMVVLENWGSETGEVDVIISSQDFNFTLSHDNNNLSYPLVYYRMPKDDVISDSRYKILIDDNITILNERNLSLTVEIIIHYDFLIFEDWYLDDDNKYTYYYEYRGNEYSKKWYLI